MEVEDALRRCGGAARWSQLRALGVTRHAERVAVAAGRVACPYPGTYVLPGVDPAIAAAVGLCGVASHASAARLHGLELYEPPRIIEVTVRRGCRQRAPGVRVYAADLAPEDTEINQPVATVRRTVRDCARTMPLLHAAADSATYRAAAVAGRGVSHHVELFHARALVADNAVEQDCASPTRT